MKFIVSITRPANYEIDGRVKSVVETIDTQPIDAADAESAVSAVKSNAEKHGTTAGLSFTAKPAPGKAK